MCDDTQLYSHVHIQCIGVVNHMRLHDRLKYSLVIQKEVFQCAAPSLVSWVRGYIPGAIFVTFASN